MTANPDNSTPTEATPGSAASSAASASSNERRNLSLSPATTTRVRLTHSQRAKSSVTFGGAATVAVATPAPPLAPIPSAGLALPSVSNRSKQRPFRSLFANAKAASSNPAATATAAPPGGAKQQKWVTREIAALEFLQMGIPMAREGAIVHEGWTRQHQPLDRSLERTSLGGKPTDDPEHKEEETSEVLPLISPALLPLENTDKSPAQQGRWWEKWIIGQTNAQESQPRAQEQPKDVRVSRDSQIEDLEEPNEPRRNQPSSAPPPLTSQAPQQPLPTAAAATIYAPGRRLEGDPATRVQIPLANALQQQPPLGSGSGQLRQNSDVDSLQLTRHQSIARMAIAREWELRVAHGLKEDRRHDPHQHEHNKHHKTPHRNPAMLDGRMYMSAKESYPMMVFSLIRYEPKKEEALRRRQKLEERGGGGTQFFIMPSRDWRGISFRALLPQKEEHQRRKATIIPEEMDEREEAVATTEKRRNINNTRLLFDRFASKKTGPKYLFPGPAAASGNDKDDGENHNGDGDEEETGIMGVDDDDSDFDEDDEEFADDTYVVGLLDDPGMVQGRHRNVMIGDRGSGPIVSSTIQFVKPKLLKADLNKQFRERFDGYEPPVSQRQFIGAKVVDGVYTLMDPTEKIDDDEAGSTSKANEEEKDDATETNTVGTSGTPTTAGATTVSAGTKSMGNSNSSSNNPRTHRRRQGSTSSVSLSTVGGGSIDGGKGEGTTETNVIRMPPSLTLSKIRSLKQQALAAAVRARLEISTVALAIIYFERLCLDCRVDKSNRRLSFAACLLLAIKINEAHVGVIETKAVTNTTSSKRRASQRIQSLIRPSKKSSTMFASLLEFFTQEWNISLKHLFAAEWGVFAALQFRLKAKPSDVAFHFRRLMKTLGYDPRRYLGSQVYGSWQQALAEEDFRRQEWEARLETRRQRKEKKKLKKLRREIEEAADRTSGGEISDAGGMGGVKTDGEAEDSTQLDRTNEIEEQNDISAQQNDLPIQTPTGRRRRLGDIFKSRIVVGSTTMAGPQKRSASTDRWMKRQGSGELSTALATTERLKMRRRGSGDVMATTNKNNSVSSVPTTALVASRQGSRPQILRPLSQSRSMLSLSAKGRELMGKKINSEEMSESKKAEIILDDLEEDDSDSLRRKRSMSIDEEKGIII